MSKRKKGFSLVENLILMVVISLTIAGLLQVSGYTIKMQMAGRSYIDSRVVAASWFAALDQVSRNTLASSPQTAFDAAHAKIGPKSKAYIIKEEQIPSDSDGTITVEITLIGENGVNSKMKRSYNIYGNYTVPDKK